ncbi:dynamin family protein [Helicobacter pylori]|uniref:dynamin family protein n=1 Tax=Helicobacter pylori TaxID=210 RepID=UPI001F198ED7|nr:dynamin family protein [Helicobacter pylori]
MVAVGGGFSAGKSSFLNHLLGLNLKLPEAMEVATAIPTYLKITIQLEEIAV